MTTGRINQVSHLDLPGSARDPKGRDVPQGRQPPHEGGGRVRYTRGWGERAPDRDGAAAYRDDANRPSDCPH